ncbi:MAG TPA: universal stress protein [Macromonas sp.]|nr:universal stress protein [Macromonas sp.]
MYQHLLVPVDNSSLSAANVVTATQLAKSLGARISFFHAVPDFGATDEGALLHAIDPVKFAEGLEGDRKAILAKAVVTTRHMGVACDGYSVRSDHPAEAIVRAAAELGCDLIVMASRGAKGVSAWLGGSKTQKVLKQSNVSLLVTRVEANDPLTARERAMGVIKDEHRTLAVVMDSIRQYAVEFAEGKAGEAERQTLQAMLDYVKAFPQKLHHPKEEAYLHPALRERCPSVAGVLAELEEQHQTEAGLVKTTDQALKAWQPADQDSTVALVKAMEALVDLVLRHIGKEEREVLPLAAQHLTDSDWQQADKAFAENRNPQFDTLESEELRQLFVRIANMTQKMGSST